MSLPSAEHQSPSCGACQSETSHDGDDFVCEDCQLAFDSYTLEARFLDEDVEPCGKPCENTWHGDHKIHRGQGYRCHPCQLPKGHEEFGGWHHWTGCEPILLDGGAS
ncbi:hypothetical protein JTZ10_21560 [Gordonia rubripertincta]|uniref:Uncharacterized protein n=1 Tax=Gordonia rubripertincta TaxID=36822 RepID=A0AAW4GBK2_GORRU|nr:hypothetical protein [Gordonia rubripertincta]MBM7280335.1 hypothetical protein [Gordonia rubripertincta]